MNRKQISNVEGTKRYTHNHYRGLSQVKPYVPHSPGGAGARDGVQGIPAGGQLGPGGELVDGALGGVDLQGVCLPLVISLVVSLFHRTKQPSHNLHQHRSFS